jgi:hypothetical protein
MTGSERDNELHHWPVDYCSELRLWLGSFPAEEHVCEQGLAGSRVVPATNETCAPKALPVQ